MLNCRIHEWYGVPEVQEIGNVLMIHAIPQRVAHRISSRSRPTSFCKSSPWMDRTWRLQTTKQQNKLGLHELCISKSYLRYLNIKGTYMYIMFFFCN